MLNSDIQQLLSRLEDFRQQMAAIKALFEGGSHVPAAKRDQARRMMKNLKERLDADCRVGSTARAQEETAGHNATPFRGPEIIMSTAFLRSQVVSERPTAGLATCVFVA
jgi:hypothetical protein